MESLRYTLDQIKFMVAAEEGDIGLIIDYLEDQSNTDLLHIIGKAARKALTKGKTEIVELLTDENSEYPILKKYHCARPQRNLELCS
ncbi:MAG: hypothetical protein PHO56_04595 [Patescibacteria group bacterium]|nr:hypothetical protein [Patescibacteria group bacterium]